MASRRIIADGIRSDRPPVAASAELCARRGHERVCRRATPDVAGLPDSAAADGGVGSDHRRELWTLILRAPVWIGRRLRRTENAAIIGGALFLSALQFYIVTNFPSWMAGVRYPHTLAGLGACYVDALPFFGWTLLSELGFGAVFFALHAWLSRGVAVRERVAA